MPHTGESGVGAGSPDPSSPSRSAGQVTAAAAGRMLATWEPREVDTEQKRHGPTQVPGLGHSPAWRSWASLRGSEAGRGGCGPGLGCRRALPTSWDGPGGGRGPQTKLSGRRRGKEYNSLSQMTRAPGALGSQLYVLQEPKQSQREQRWGGRARPPGWGVSPLPGHVVLVWASVQSTLPHGAGTPSHPPPSPSGGATVRAPPEPLSQTVWKVEPGWSEGL